STREKIRTPISRMRPRSTLSSSGRTSTGRRLVAQSEFRLSRSLCLGSNAGRQVIRTRVTIRKALAAA
ncbi:hypothetical protein DACRYDRAFT_24814, partial [Dacryopinax primogenitus]